MATIQIENLPDELYSSIQTLATENSITLNEAVIYLLKQAFLPHTIKIDQEQPQPQLMSEVLQRIRSRTRVNPIDFGLPDSTVLIQEDRNR
jgi:hypothetical protein